VSGRLDPQNFQMYWEASEFYLQPVIETAIRKFGTKKLGLGRLAR